MFRRVYRVNLFNVQPLFLLPMLLAREKVSSQKTLALLKLPHPVAEKADRRGKYYGIIKKKYAEIKYMS